MTIENPKQLVPPGIQLRQILQGLASGQPLTDAIQVQLAEQLRQNKSECRAFEITSDCLDAVVRERSHLFQTVYPALGQFYRDRFRSHQYPLELLWQLWLPLAVQILEHRQRLGQPLIQGILGVQGTGKTTLAAILTLILNHLGCRVCCLSLDDLYLTYTDRLQLQQTDPRLRWRGPPGTHDVDLGLRVLEQLRRPDRHHPVQVPRFDKSAWNGAGDRTSYETVMAVDVVLFEGWFVGIRPIDPSAFDTAPPPIVTAEDQAFARDCNARLATYLPLWHQLNHLIVLHPTDYRFSQQWRQQAEHQMMATGRPGMTDEAIRQFVEYFWRSLHPELLIKPLLQDAERVDLVIEISADHIPGAIYRPGERSSGLENRSTDCLNNIG